MEWFYIELYFDGPAVMQKKKHNSPFALNVLISGSPVLVCLEWAGLSLGSLETMWLISSLLCIFILVAIITEKLTFFYHCITWPRLTIRTWSVCLSLSLVCATEEQAFRKRRLCIKFIPRDSTEAAICDIRILGRSKQAPPQYTFIGWAAREVFRGKCQSITIP